MAKEKITGKIFDMQLFKRLLSYITIYKLAFYISLLSVILLALFAAVRPVLLIKIVDDYITTKNATQVLNYSILMFVVLLIEVVFQFLFIFYANYLGQHIIKDKLALNNIYDWKPTAPTRFFHGIDDEIVPYHNAEKALDTMINNGATNVSLGDCSLTSHVACVAPFIIDTVIFFRKHAHDL